MKHGKAGTPVYRSWHSMMRRCLDPKHRCFHNYGARGISICEEWKSFENFYRDMGDRPTGMTLDRINNDLGYFKNNCRWATKREQDNNRRTCRYVTFNGVTKSVRDWAEYLNIPHERLRARLKRNWPIEEVLSGGIFDRWSPRIGR